MTTHVILSILTLLLSLAGTAIVWSFNAGRLRETVKQLELDIKRLEVDIDKKMSHDAMLEVKAMVLAMHVRIDDILRFLTPKH